MDTFAFFIHNTNWEFISKAFGEPLLKFTGPGDVAKKRLAERVLRWADPFMCSEIQNIRSINGKETNGYFIFSMLVPEQLLHMEQEYLIRHIVKGGEIAKKLNAKILGLGAYTALVGRRGAQIAKALNMPVTTGTSFTIASSVDAIFLAAKILEIDLSGAHCTVVGASGTIGSIFAKLISREVGSINLVARNIAKLKNLAESINLESPQCNVAISTDIKESMKDADIVLFCTNYPDVLISSADIPPGTIICDLSIPKNVPFEVYRDRKDILLIEGGLVKCPGNPNFNFFYGPAANNTTYACVAETIILSLEKVYESFSLGGNVTTEKVELISKLGRENGFIVDDLRSHYGAIGPDRLYETRKARRDRKITVRTSAGK